MIDEFDKMNDKDRTSIHEAMEQQSISISKAGIVTQLQARCSVIAAANPITGRYDTSHSFSENVDLTEPILSRFDILCVVRDTVDVDTDERLSNFVVQSHKKSLERRDDEDVDMEREEESTDLPQSLLKKYIVYARKNCHPKLNSVDKDKITKVYSDLRNHSRTGGGVMTVRHVESIIRMAEAHAKMHLREQVINEDVDMAIRIMVEGYISAQKYSVSERLRKAFRTYLNYRRNDNERLLFLLQTMVREQVALINVQGDEQLGDSLDLDLEEFEARAKDQGVSRLTAFYRSNLFKENHFNLRKAQKKIIKTLV